MVQTTEENVGCRFQASNLSPSACKAEAIAMSYQDGKRWIDEILKLIQFKLITRLLA